MLKTEAINLLLANFKAEVTDGLMQGYSIGVREYSENTVEQSVINFLQGKVSAHNSAFCPTPAELAKECDRIVNGAASDPNSPLERFLAASAQNKEQTRREDLKLEDDRGPNRVLLDNPEYRKAGRILTDKSLSPGERAKAAKEMTKIRTGSKFKGKETQ